MISAVEFVPAYGRLSVTEPVDKKPIMINKQLWYNELLFIRFEDTQLFQNEILFKTM